jgi:hypothetical protein
MNRPFWLDIVYIMVVFSPAVCVAYAVARYIGPKGFWGLAAFTALSLVCIVLWIVILLAWAWVWSWIRGSYDS